MCYALLVLLLLVTIRAGRRRDMERREAGDSNWAQLGRGARGAGDAGRIRGPQPHLSGQQAAPRHRPNGKTNKHTYKLKEGCFKCDAQTGVLSLTLILFVMRLVTAHVCSCFQMSILYISRHQLL